MEAWGRVGSTGLGLLSVLVRAAVAVSTAGLEALGIADVSSSVLDDCRAVVLAGGGWGGAGAGAAWDFEGGTFGTWKSGGTRVI